MSTQGSSGGGFNFDTEAGIAQLLKSVRTANLPGEEKNDIRDTIFLYINGGRDQTVRISLEQKLASHGIVPSGPLPESAPAGGDSMSFTRSAPSDFSVSASAPPVAPTPPAPPPQPAPAPAQPTTPVQTPAPPPQPTPVTPPPTPAPVTQTPPPQPVPAPPPPAPQTPPPPAPQPVPSTPPPDAQIVAGQNPEVYLERIREIKSIVNQKVGNPVNLVDINNEVGREYMGALLDAMKKINSGASAVSSMQRLENSFKSVEQALADHQASPQPAPASVTPPPAPAPVQTTPPVQTPPPQPVTPPVAPAPVAPPPTPTQTPVVPQPAPPPAPKPTPPPVQPTPPPQPVEPPPRPQPPTPKPEPVQTPPKPVPPPVTPEPVKLPPVPQPPEKKPTPPPSPKPEPKPEPQPLSKPVPKPEPELLPKPVPKPEPKKPEPAPDTDTVPPIPKPKSEKGKENPRVPLQDVPDKIHTKYDSSKDEVRWSGSNKAEEKSISKIPSLADSLSEDKAKQEAEKEKIDVPRPESIDPLYSKEVDEGLNQLLTEWSLFKKSGLFGTGPKGREHPLFKKIAGLQIPLLLAGRFEGATQEIKQSITDYMNGWRYEQGIMYTQGETFERYLRRVIKHILDLQKKKTPA